MRAESDGESSREREAEEKKRRKKLKLSSPSEACLQTSRRRFSLPLPPSLLSLSSLFPLSLFSLVLTASTSGFVLEMPPPVGYVSTPDISRASPDARALSKAATVESAALPPGSEALSGGTTVEKYL